MKILLEKYVNAFNKQDKEAVWEDVNRLVNTAYSALPGGALGFDKSKFMRPNIFVKLVKRNNKYVACAVYSLEHTPGNYEDIVKPENRKLRYIGHDGTKEGKREVLNNIFKEDINLQGRRFWAEVSGKIEEIYLSKGAVPVPNEVALKVLTTIMGKSVEEDKIELSKDGYHYTRLIDGVPVEKMIVGNVGILKQFS